MIAFAVGCGGSGKPPVATAKAVAHSPPKPTCLVLSVGGPQGVAHLGAIEVLRARGIKIGCVVGNSMGSLVGALYASRPQSDTTAEFQSMMANYMAATKDEAVGRGALAGIVGFIFFGPVGAALGGASGALTVRKLEHDRLVEVLDRHLGGVDIEAMPVPFATSFAEQMDQKIAFVEVSTGNTAQAVGGSVANPFIFGDIDVRAGGPIDPGMDRIAAVPVEQACAFSPASQLLVINVTPEPAFYSARMRCRAYEVRVNVPAISPEAILTVPEAFAATVQAGREATDAWLATPEGRHFLRSSRRSDFGVAKTDVASVVAQ